MDFSASENCCCSGVFASEVFWVVDWITIHRHLFGKASMVCILEKLFIFFCSNLVLLQHVLTLARGNLVSDTFS